MKRALVLAALAACARPQLGPPPDPPSPLRVFAEGLCPKLDVFAAGEKTFLVYGSYGLDEKGAAGTLGAAQSFVELRNGLPFRDLRLFGGLPAGADGWIAGDLELGGRWPDALWLALVETARGKGESGALFERRRGYYTWEGAWQLGARAHQAATLGMALPDLPEHDICSGELHFANYATARLASGDTIVAGRCEDALGRAPGGVELASYVTGERWRLDDAPPSELFADIVNLALVHRSRREAYLYAYPPYATGETAAYLVRFDGERWTQVPLPFEGPLVAMTADDSGALWAITGWRTLRRFQGGQWQRVPVPAPRFVSPAPERMRLLDVQTVAGQVWLHAAYPASVDGAATRGHVLYTTGRATSPLYCNRRLKAEAALGHDGETLHGADELR